MALLLGVLLVSVLPQLRRQWIDLRAERVALDVAQGWRVARTLAVTQGRQVDWTWDAAARTVRLAAADPTVPLESRWDRPRAVPEGVALSVRQEGRAVERVSFFPDGAAGDAPVTCTIGATGTTLHYDITLDPVTGQARLR